VIAIGTAALVATAVAVVFGVLRSRYLTVAVTGTSMLPTLMAGDRVLVRRLRRGRLRLGQLVVANRPDPGGQTVLVVKRVGAVETPPGTVTLLGDNTANSRDSRHWGPCPRDQVLGVVVTIFDRR
jgi:signal peptidase I